MNGDHRQNQNAPGVTSSVSVSANSFASLTSNRASPFSSSTATTTSTMAAPSYLPRPSAAQAAQAFNNRQGMTSPVGYYTPGKPFDRDAAKPVGTPFAATPSPTYSVARIRKLPANFTEDQLRLMMALSKDLIKAELLPADVSDDAGFRTAILTFKTLEGAQETRQLLNGKTNMTNDAEMIVEIIQSDSVSSSTRFSIDTSVSAATSAVTSPTALTAPSSRQVSRFNGTFQSLDRMSPPLNTAYGSTELGSPEATAHYQNLFSAQSPIGNYLTDGSRATGKTLINNDSADDDETGEILKEIGGFAEGGPQQRRSTSSQLPITRMANLSLNTSVPTTMPQSMSHYSQSSMGGMGAHSATMSPTNMMGGPVPMMPHAQPYRRHPPANPADMNPPCNTLYVGNLPIDTSEEELKAVFSKVRGYKRLCYRTKHNGPMCFVEFEDVSFATKALNELYGHTLSNSRKGGMRLSFSKNPLGVRTGQAPGQNGAGPMNGMNGFPHGPNTGFTTASGPPPGLSAPPGLGMNRSLYSGSPNMHNGHNPYTPPPFPTSQNPWASSFNGSSQLNGNSQAQFPAYMMGR